jgi:NAD(P)-dependent dehydrogenase (short-subunit alcohol dehydrogenase family)
MGMRMDEMFSLHDQVAVVTGAASGLGLAIAEVLAQQGARVLMLDMHEPTLTSEVERLQKSGWAVQGQLVDVADSPKLHQCLDDWAQLHQRLDIAVANAGITAGPGYQTDTGHMQAVEMQTWNRVLSVNLTSVFETIRGAARHMVNRRYGRIIAVASVAGLRAEPMVGYAYAATKAAVINLVRQTAMELAPSGVLVNGIAPGPFRTNIANGRIKDPLIAQQFADTVPLGRIADPSEIQGLALLLASPAASYLCGVTIPIDGGVTAV